MIARLASGAVVALVVVLAVREARAVRDVRLPAPATEAYARGAREADDDACRSCHVTEARTHARSLHAGAFSDAAFQEGYRLEAKPVCRACHAPEADPRAAPDAFASTRGVTCVTCHRPDPSGPVLASDRRARGAPHPLARVRDFGTRACAGCHEFAFPGAETLGERGLVQKTLTEHARSRFADRTCAACHMERASHDVSAFRADLASAIDVAARREDERVTFVLAPRDVGHALPTGDLFRSVVVRVLGPRGPAERSLGRTFAAKRVGDAVARVEQADARLDGVSRVVLPAPRGVPLPWQVLLRRGLAVEQAPPFAERVASEVILAEGILEPAPRGAYDATHE